MLAVEAATGVDRSVLRPDLYGERHPNAGDVDEVDAARAQEYTLLAALLARAPDQALLDRLATLRGDAIAARRCACRARRGREPHHAERVEREYFNLFIGLGRGELLPYGSYYLSGFLHERPLARLREELARLGIERAEGKPSPRITRRSCARSWPV